MAPLAEAFVRIRSDPSMLAGDVRRDASRAGTVGGTVMGREFGTAFRRVSRILIGLGIGTFAVQAGRFAVDMADKFELSRSRLETVTKNLGGDFSAISDQVQALDDRLAAFGFTNADVEGSVASLESATKSSTKALQDAALAADIARGRNISLESATQILMRVETGHVAMLSRLGIATKDANGHLLTQQEALTQLARLYGGSASHFAGTFAGKQQALRAELGNTASEIGVALLPAAVDLAHVLQHDILPPLESSAKFFDRNRRAIEPLVGMVIKLTLAYKAMKALGRLSVGLSAAQAGSGALSVARPVPVFVTNWQGGGPGVVGKTTTEAETAAVEEATLRSRLGAALPKLGRNALRGFIVATVADALGNVVGGGGGSFIKTVGKGAGFGSVLGPEGTVAGGALTAAGIGVNAGVGALSNALAPSNAESKVIQQLMANGAGPANLAKLQQIAASQTKTGGRVGPEVQLEITQLKAALTATHAKTAADGQEAGAETHAASAVRGHTLSLKDQAKALANAQSKALDLANGQDALRQAVHNMAVTAGQGGRALKGNSDAALANRDALRGAVQQAESYLTTLKQHGASAPHVAQVELNLARAIKTSATNTYQNSGAVQQLLKQLGFLPGRIQAVVDALGSTPPAFNKWMGSERRGLGDFVTTHAKGKAKDAGSALADSLLTGYTPVVTSGLGNATSHAVDTAFNTAKSKMQADLSSIKQFYASQRQTLISTFGSLNLTPTTDSFGDSGPALSFKAQLRRDAQQMDTFARLYKRLDALNLDPRLLMQISGLGPDGIPAMRQLLASGAKGIRQVDRLERRIAGDASQIAAVQTADKFSEQIHGDLEKLPHRLAVEMRKELPKAVIKISLEDVGRRRAKRIRSS